MLVLLVCHVEPISLFCERKGIHLLAKKDSIVTILSCFKQKMLKLRAKLHYDALISIKMSIFAGSNEIPYRMVEWD